MLVYPLGCLRVIQEHTNPLRRSPHGPLGLSRSQKRSRGSQDPSSSDQNLWSVHGCFMVQPMPNPETKGIFEESIHGLMIMAHINVQLVSASEVNSQNNQCSTTHMLNDQIQPIHHLQNLRHQKMRKKRVKQ